MLPALPGCRGFSRRRLLLRKIEQKFLSLSEKCQAAKLNAVPRRGGRVGKGLGIGSEGAKGPGETLNDLNK